MRGLRLFLPPFAPDTAGAASVFFPLGGLVVIVDAGGCAGNIIGFDEPRARSAGTKSVVVSAALRDMDAILGRDEQLVARLADTVEEFAQGGRSFPFAALIGTPVPAVIGTDYRALCRLAERQARLPVLAVDTDGTQSYDTGVSKAYLALFQHLARLGHHTIARGTLGVLGATPLDTEETDGTRLRQKLHAAGWRHLRLYGLDHRAKQYREASANEKNLVVAPAGLAAAQWLEKTFGTPYEVDYPLVNEDWEKIAPSPLPRVPKNILLLHQQFRTRALRRLLKEKFPEAAITCATFFQQVGAYIAPQDRKLREEQSLPALVAAGGFDCIIGDNIYRRAIPDYRGIFLDFPHFAASGRLRKED